MLAGNEDITDISEIKIDASTHKTGVGFNTKTYDFYTNSAGQDNIGQILTAIWRIKELKDLLEEQYPGAVLLIDELDATLHPASQIKLINLLISQARELEMQIIFTTHSMSIIKEINDKVMHNSKLSNNIELVYITSARGYLEIEQNPSIELINNEINARIEPFSPRIKIYTEDEEARWFLRNLLEYFGQQYTMNLRIIDDMKIGCDSLIALYKTDTPVFNDVIVILDGDASKNIPTIGYGEQERRDFHFLTLPGTKSPEAVFLDFLCDKVDCLKDFYSISRIKESGLNPTNLTDTRVSIEENPAGDDKKKRDLRKDWFSQVKPLLEEGKFFHYWASANEEVCEQFRLELTASYNYIAEHLRIKPL